MNANDAQLVRVYTRETGRSIADHSPRVSGAAAGGNVSFEVVVEAEAGDVLGGIGAPYLLTLAAFDKTTGQLAAPSTAFAKNPTEAFNANYGNISKWPLYKSYFTVTLTQAQADALVGHVLQYTAALINPLPGGGSPPNVVSFLESEPFILV